MRKSDKRVTGKAAGGPGGIKCDCCRPGGASTVKEAANIVRRYLRRLEKERIRRELYELNTPESGE